MASTFHSSTWKKLNLKDHNQVAVFNAPESFEPELAALHEVRVFRGLPKAGDVPFSLAFVTKQQEVEMLATAIAGRAAGDAIVWFAYPKGSSKKYKSEIARDNGWEILGRLGFEPVRGVAIDDDWSALRFRRVEFIRTMTRAKESRMTEQGKARVSR